VAGPAEPELRCVRAEGARGVAAIAPPCGGAKVPAVPGCSAPQATRPGGERCALMCRVALLATAMSAPMRWSWLPGPVGPCVVHSLPREVATHVLLLRSHVPWPCFQQSCSPLPSLPALPRHTHADQDGASHSTPARCQVWDMRGGRHAGAQGPGAAAGQCTRHGVHPNACCPRVAVQVAAPSAVLAALHRGRGTLWSLVTTLAANVL